MIKITLPDSSVREFESGVTGMQIAEAISNRLAKDVLSVSVNGEVWDLTRPITGDASIKLNTWDDREGKETFWHSSAHLMAEAIENYFPGTRFGIGPTVDNGFYYDIDLPGGQQLTEKDLEKVEQKMLELARGKEDIVRSSISKADAMQLFSEKGDELKLELISELEDGTITLYKQGNFTDLCRGPHLPNSGYIKAIKLMSIAGAYWRGDEKNKMLTRVYGITFPKQKMLEEYLVLLEEAKKRDHRKIGKELELFTFSEAVGQGLPLWLPKGAQLRAQLEDFLKKIQKRFGYDQVITPHIGDVQLYKTSGHYEKYGKDSFQVIKTPAEGEEYLLKPMNCPHHCEIYKAKPHSYKDLPLRMAEFGTVYRYEMSGELHGLTRVRGFTQDDAHIFCAEGQVQSEVSSFIDLLHQVYADFGFTRVQVKLSTRPVNRVGSDEVWDRAEAALEEALNAKGLEWQLQPGEGAFYGPKIEFSLSDCLDRVWQCGTIQVDFSMPERLGAVYVAEDGSKRTPVILHRAILGSLERFIGILVEHYAGYFPLWLAPVQAMVLNITDAQTDYARGVEMALRSRGLRAESDLRNEKIGFKIREHSMQRVPYLIIVGEKEIESRTVSLRTQKGDDLGLFSLDGLMEKLCAEVNERVATP